MRGKEGGVRTLDEIAFDDGNCRGCHGIPESQGGYGHDSDCWFRAALSEAVAEERKALRAEIQRQTGIAVKGKSTARTMPNGEAWANLFQGAEEFMAKLEVWLNAREEHPREGKPALPLGHAFWMGYSAKDSCRILLGGETTCGEPESAHREGKPAQEGKSQPCECSGDGHKPDCAFWMSLASPAQEQGGGR